jgi:hypothetical protein
MFGRSIALSCSAHERNDTLWIFGGFADNMYLDDVWMYNTTTARWLEKTAFVHPIYPQNCTDDLDRITAENCTHLSWRKDINRQVNDACDLPCSYLTSGPGMRATHSISYHGASKISTIRIRTLHHTLVSLIIRQLS